MSPLRWLTRGAVLPFLALAIILPLHFLTRVPSEGGWDSAEPVRQVDVPRRRRLPLPISLAPAALALFLAVYLLGLAPGGSSASAGPVRIESVRINHLPEASSPSIEVEVELKNHDHAAHDVQAWWLLARPDANRPWDVYSFRSSTRGPVTLAAGEKVTLGWQEEVTAEPGDYQLSAWVHTVDGGETRHSDGKRVDDPVVRIDSGWSPLIRRATPPPGLEVSAIDLAAATSEGGLRVPAQLRPIIVVRNDTAVDTTADVQWFLYPKASTVPWNAKPAYTSRLLRHKVFAANAQTTITTSEPISLWPGEYLLRVVARETGGKMARPATTSFWTRQ